MSDMIPRQPERRRLTPEQRQVLLELEEFSHQPGTVSSGKEWHAVPRDLLIRAAELIRSLRRIDS